MPAPTPYERQYSFQAFQATQPTVPLPADKVDSEYNAVKLTLDEILANLGLIQRADGQLANQSVGLEQLAANLTLGINVPAIWETGESYVPLDAVFVENGLYRCLVAHTASASFGDDQNSGYWLQLCDFGGILVAGNNGWSPVFGAVADGTRRCLKVLEWVGGAGVAPEADVYVGATGFVETVDDAVDIRGAPGVNGDGAGTVIGPDSAVSGNLVAFDGIDGTTVVDAGKSVSDLQLSSGKGAANGYAELDSNAKVPTSQLPDSVLGAMQYQGAWNADTNSPTIPAAASGNKGHYYKVATAGTTTVDGLSDWKVGDWIVSNGSAWDKINNNDTVASVAGRTGSVTLVKSDVGLGNVDNTSDVNKPVSNAAQAVLDVKEALGSMREVETKTASYVLTAADAGKTLESSSSGDVVFTIPKDVFTKKAWGNFVRIGSGNLTIEGPDVTLRSGDDKFKLNAQNSMATWYCRGTNDFVLGGDLKA